MPLDPNIILQGQVPDVGESISNAILNTGRLSALQTEQIQRDLIAERLQQLKNIGPVAQRMQEAQTAGEERESLRGNILDSARQLQPVLESGDGESARRILFALKDSISQVPGSEKGVLEVEEIIRQIDQDDLSSAKKMVEGILSADKTRRSPYHIVKPIVVDGKTYEVPFDTRSNRWDFDNMQLSPKTPTQEGAVSEAKAGGRTTGEARATAKLDLPAVKSNGTYLKSLVRGVLEHPAYESVVGMPSLGKGMQFVPGSPEADFRLRMKQVTGKQFMQAYETLKGGGQITEIEGQKATEAMSRMNTASSEEEFRTAALEFISEIERLERLAEQRASGKEPTVKRLRYNPETGKIE